MRKLALLALSGVVVMAASTVAWTAPRTSKALSDWQLEFTHAAPQRILVTLPGQAQPKLYWYMIYRVVNNTGRDRMFFPMFDLVYETEDTVKTAPADMGINPAVFEAIKAKHGKAYPFLTEPVQAIGRLLQGADNAKTTVAIWPKFDARADKFSIFAAGLSGKTELRRNPNYMPSKPETVARTMPDGTKVDITVNPRFFTLRMMFKLDYVLPGDVATSLTINPREIGRSSVMR